MVFCIICIVALVSPKGVKILACSSGERIVDIFAILFSISVSAGPGLYSEDEKGFPQFGHEVWDSHLREFPKQLVGGVW